MHVDLLTLYFLAIGTLLASSVMTLWECRTHPKRGNALRLLAAGYATLAVGCVSVLVRHRLPGAWGSALSNLIMMCGYLLILQGVAAVNGKRYKVGPIVLLLAVALMWAIAGTSGQYIVWNYVSAIPIALVSGLTCRELVRSEGIRAARSRRNIVVAVTGVHALFYVFRALILPWFVGAYGPGVQAIASIATMYEGVLYSVILPMTLLALFRDETHSELLRASQTDYLTHLGNRRWFFEEGARVMRADGARQSVSVLAFDLDQFKAINDRHGHKTGDEVLKAFAKIARAVLGPDTIIARIGGEEFAALLHGIDDARARELGETIAARFAETIAHTVNDVDIQATVSIGFASATQTALTLSELLATADQALYRAKSLGGNRLEMATTRAQAVS